MLLHHFFGCNRVEIWPNSFNFDHSMPYSKFHTFWHLKAYGGALLCVEKIYMSCYSRLLRPFNWLSFLEYLQVRANYRNSNVRFIASIWLFYNHSGKNMRLNRLCVILKSSYLRTLNLIKHCSNKLGHSNSYKFSPYIIMHLHMP